MVVRKRKFRYLILLTAGLLAVNMPLSAQAEDMAVETEIKVPVEEEAAEDLNPVPKEALKKKEMSDEKNSKSEDYRRDSRRRAYDESKKCLKVQRISRWRTVTSQTECILNGCLHCPKKR